MTTLFTQRQSSSNISWLIKSSLATIALTAFMSANPVLATSTQVSCGAGNNKTRTCNLNVGKIKGVVLKQQTGRRTCVPGQNYGQSKKGIWTRDGCKGNFDVYHGKLTKAERQRLRGIAGNKVAQPVISHNNNSNGNDVGKGLVVLGGLLVGAAILHEIFDDNHTTTTVTHTPVTPHVNPPVNQPTYNNSQWGNGTQWSHGTNNQWNQNGWNNNTWSNNTWNNNNNGNRARNRQKAIDICSSTAVNDALANGYTSASVSGLTSVEKVGKRRWKISGTITQQFKQRNHVRRSSHWRNWNSWSDWRNGGGHRNQPQYVTVQETRNFTCVVKKGTVRSFNKW